MAEGGPGRRRYFNLYDDPERFSWTRDLSAQQKSTPARVLSDVNTRREPDPKAPPDLSASKKVPVFSSLGHPANHPPERPEALNHRPVEAQTDTGGHRVRNPSSFGALGTSYPSVRISAERVMDNTAGGNQKIHVGNTTVDSRVITQPRAAQPTPRPFSPAPKIVERAFGALSADYRRVVTQRVALVLQCPDDSGQPPHAMLGSLIEEKYYEKFSERLPLNWVELIIPEDVTVSTLGDKNFLWRTPTKISAEDGLAGQQVESEVEKSPEVLSKDVAAVPQELAFPTTPWLVQVTHVTTKKVLMKIQDERITRALEESFRLAWEESKATNVPISFETSSPPAQGQEMVVIRDVRGVLEFERAIVSDKAMKTPKAKPAFFRVFLKDRGFYDDCVHVSNMFPIPKNAPRCDPLSTWTNLALFEDVKDDDYVALAVLELVLVKQRVPYYAFVVVGKGKKLSIVPPRKVSPDRLDDANVAISTVVKKCGGKIEEKFVNADALALIDLTYSVTDLARLEPLEKRRVVLANAFVSGNFAVVVQDDIDTLCAVTRALRHVLKKPGVKCASILEEGRTYMVKKELEVGHLVPKEFPVTVFRGCIWLSSSVSAKSTSGSNIKFYALDFGKIVYIDDPSCVYDLYEIAPRLSAIPHKAQVCSLEGIPPKKHELRNTAEEYKWIERAGLITMPVGHKPLTEAEAEFACNGCRLHEVDPPKVHLFLTADPKKDPPGPYFVNGSADGDTKVTPMIDVNVVMFSSIANRGRTPLNFNAAPFNPQ